MASNNKKKTVKIIDDKLSDLKTSFELKYEELLYRISQVEEFMKKHDIENVVAAKEFKCNICDEIFPTNKEVDCHIQSTHPKVFKCRLCSHNFSLSKDLETHIKNQHNSTELKCDSCEKVFYMKWRLNKHKEIHTSVNVRHCHYFNNGKNCPFEDIGCKFLHRDWEVCKFGKSCNIIL